MTKKKLEKKLKVFKFLEEKEKRLIQLILIQSTKKNVLFGYKDFLGLKGVLIVWI